ncbi:hypothetical protein ABVN55_09595 [Fusobacterium animalis]|uniref:hypothetical protein n=1 Tax=Fusobacterium TaxID=848 RepID=UPI0003B816C5|nr:hypothetical protein [Fusobacterium nucleatum]ERT35659.1 hypothetical protein HMPREF1766_01194 [Fusobacterium nucleatum CTI-5]
MEKEEVEKKIIFFSRSVFLRYVLTIFITFFTIFFIKDILFSNMSEFCNICRYIISKNSKKIAYFIIVMLVVFFIRRKLELCLIKKKLFERIVKNIYDFFPYIKIKFIDFETRCIIILSNLVSLLIILSSIRIPFSIDFYVQKWDYIFLVVFIMGILEYYSYHQMKVYFEKEDDRYRLKVEAFFRVLIFFVIICNGIYIVQNTSL